MQRLTLIFGIAAALVGCTEPEPLYCNGTTRLCTDPALPYCDVSRKRCVELPDGFTMDMSDSGDAADMPMCTQSSMCTDPPSPICGAGTCRACGGDQECADKSGASPRCESGKCVACRAATQATDCSTATPICGAGNACRKCEAHGECTSGICKDDGACAAVGDIAYVDNRGMTVIACQANVGITKNGNSFATAYCDIADAESMATAKPFALAKGSNQPYSAFTIDRNLVVVGPGGQSSPTVRVLGSAVAKGVLVQGTTAAVIDGVEVTGGAVGNEGIACLKNAGAISIDVRRSHVHDNNGPGVSATNCTVALSASNVSSNNGGGVLTTGAAVTLSGNVIQSNAGGGISLTVPAGLLYMVVNNFIVANGNAGAGVALLGDGTGRFLFNTVADNTRTGGALGGINCDVAATLNKKIEMSIVWGNAKQGGSQFTSKCDTLFVDADETLSGAGHISSFNIDPVFVNAGTGNYRIQTGSPCKDKVVAGAAPMLPGVDVDGNPRPRPVGGNWDVGAHEFQ